MARPMRNIAFRFMTTMLRIRDFFLSPQGVVQEAGVEEGKVVLDYGCGPGTRTLAAARLVGPTGQVHAADIHPLSGQRIARLATQLGLENIRTICTDCDTGLADESVDVVLFHDIFHMLDQPSQVLAELHRVLKADGILAFSDHHQRERTILQGMTRDGLFERVGRRKHSHLFRKRPTDAASRKGS
jgi:ubiquinone/menaquinone biosynthesis C-methylase UbiE